MLSSTIRTVISVLFILAGIGVAFGLYMLKKAPAQRAESTASVMVSVAAVKAYTGPLSLDLTGLVVPFREINVVSEVTGKVVFKSEEFRAGRYVKAGTVLMQVDQTDYDLEISRIDAELKQTASSLEELEVEIKGARELMEIATNDLSLQQAEYTRKSNPAAGLSTSELDQAKRAVLAAQNALSSQTSRLNQLEQSRNRWTSTQAVRRADLEMAQIRKSRCIITAPADGVVVSENVELNGFVQPGATIMVFEDTSRAEVRCNLRQDQLDWLWKHAPQAATQATDNALGTEIAYRIPRVPVKVRYASGSEQIEWDGMLDRFDGLGIDQRTKTIPTRVVVAQPIAVGSRGNRALVRGMFVKLRIELPTEPLRELNQFFVELPNKSILPGNKVWVYRDNKLVVQRVEVVNTIESPDGRRAVVPLVGEGLLLTDQVVTTPVGTYTSNMTVKIISKTEGEPLNAKDVDPTRLTSQSTTTDSGVDSTENADSAATGSQK
ncbi:MAG: HlyD family efflux transporter periplasmic adaptor subunit [Planctomycetaceae bacterium]|nr:HlyD family efflux transporter periplasmic adaptor subunit [Planctomycetaceae bacterium]